jgi:hypothetical protein
LCACLQRFKPASSRFEQSTAILALTLLPATMDSPYPRSWTRERRPQIWAVVSTPFSTCRHEGVGLTGRRDHRYHYQLYRLRLVDDTDLIITSQNMIQTTLSSECSKPWTYGKEAFELPAAQLSRKVSLPFFFIDFGARHRRYVTESEAPHNSGSAIVTVM